MKELIFTSNILHSVCVHVSVCLTIFICICQRLSMGHHHTTCYVQYNTNNQFFFPSHFSVQRVVQRTLKRRERSLLYKEFENLFLTITTCLSLLFIQKFFFSIQLFCYSTAADAERMENKRKRGERKDQEKEGRDRMKRFER